MFDDDWRVVALHHASTEIPEETYRGEVVKYNTKGLPLTRLKSASRRHPPRDRLGSGRAMPIDPAA